MPDIATLNYRWAWELLDSLATAGVKHLVLSPGSRSTPLALAGARHPRLRTWVRVDERGAAFFALGLATSTGVPAVLVATSGTAVANWFPAVVEANRGEVPLVLISADRPPEAQDCGANQTIDQVKLFGDQVRAYHGLPVPEEHDEARAGLRATALRVLQQSRWPTPGPVHINQPFREPLVPATLPDLQIGPGTVTAAGAAGVDANTLEQVRRLVAGRPGLIVCGPLPGREAIGAAVTRLARRLDCPILADPLSNLRFGAHDRTRVCCHYDAFLRNPGFADEHRPAWVLRMGPMPVSRTLAEYLARQSGCQHILVNGTARWPDPLHQTTHLLRSDPEALCDGLAADSLQAIPADWTRAFLAAEDRARVLASDKVEALPLERDVVGAVIRLLPEHGIVFASNSLPIRFLDQFSGSGPKRLLAFANRGASGIDGNLSTATGLAAGTGRPVVGLVGDLACFHDLNALAYAGDHNIIFVVLNNGGGGIFHFLPQHGLPGFRDLWCTPVHLDLEHAAGLFGLSYRRVAGTGAEIDAALAGALAHPGPGLVEVMVDPAASASANRAYWSRVAAG